MSYRIHRLAPIVAAAGGSYDTDAQAFFTAAGITDSTQKSAINQLVLDLKSASIWTKMLAIYPFVGGDATKHSYNLKNTAQYQITWSGTITHDANGITGNGTTGYGNTGLNASTATTLNDLHFSAYSRSSGQNNGYVLSCNTGSSAAIHLTIRDTGNQSNGVMYRDDTGNAFVTKNSETTGAGHYITSRRSSTDMEGYKNGTSFATQTNTNTGTRPNQSFFISAYNNNGSPLSFSNRNLALVSIGSGLTDTDASNFYTAVQNYQTTLGRNV